MPAPLSMVRRFVVALAFVVFSLAFGPRPALAWGDQGHEIIALVAERFLDLAVREKIAAMLAADADTLTAHDIASEATWADGYRDSDRNGSRQHYAQTRDWHFVNVELTNPNLDAACFSHPPLAAGTVASNGPSQACIVDKIEQLAAELADSSSIWSATSISPSMRPTITMPVEIENASSRWIPTRQPSSFLGHRMGRPSRS